MIIEAMPPIPAGENPFHHDQYHMGVDIGKNVTVMMANHSNQECKYMIVVDVETGQRTKLVFKPEHKPELFNCFLRAMGAA